MAQIFETKVRTPFKIVFEVCRLSELKGEYQPKRSSPVKKVKTNFGEYGGTGGNLNTQTQENEENQVGFGGENENYMIEEDFKSNYRKTIY